MRWSCPACQLPIRHSDVEAHPHGDIVYRCHICRLALTVSPMTERLAIGPSDNDNDTCFRLGHVEWNLHLFEFEIRSTGARGWEARILIDGSIDRFKQFATLGAAAHWAEAERLAVLNTSTE